MTFRLADSLMTDASGKFRYCGVPSCDSRFNGHQCLQAAPTDAQSMLFHMLNINEDVCSCHEKSIAANKSLASLCH